VKPAGGSVRPEGRPERPIRVLVIDDTAFMRRAVTEILAEDSRITVVGAAQNGLEALSMIRSLAPDVITLDIDMPVMDGLTTIRHVMIEMPLPIVVLSSLVTDGNVTFEALRLGVVDFVPKPSGAVSTNIRAARQQLIDRVIIAHSMRLPNVRRVRLPRRWKSEKRLSTLYRYYPLEYAIAVGTTLSGPNTVIRLLSKLSPTLPACILVMQEISPKIIHAFVGRFDETVHWKVVAAFDGAVVEQGVCYICSNENSMTLDLNEKGEVVIRVGEGGPEPLNRLFRSTVDIFRQHTIGVLLSGLGEDGADGFADIKQAMGVTMVKDVDCCVYPNLTDNAVKRGVVDLRFEERRLAEAIQSVMK
jgi:two-component system chemotaxis response regulator CheB